MLRSAPSTPFALPLADVQTTTRRCRGPAVIRPRWIASGGVIPCRRKGRRDDAAIRTLQVRDGIHLIIAQGEIEHVEVALHMLGLSRARDHDHSPLLQQPA